MRGERYCFLEMILEGKTVGKSTVRRRHNGQKTWEIETAAQTINSVSKVQPSDGESY